MWSCFACLTSHPSGPLSPPVRFQKGLSGWGQVLGYCSFSGGMPDYLPPLFLTWGPW